MQAWHQIWGVFLDATLEIAPYFLLAILLGAIIEEFVSERTIGRFLTGHRPGTMALVSVLGALIPLCTCGMVPLAVSLRRRGSDLKHTMAFLTAGAAVSIPVLFLTWKVLGLEWTAARLAASVVFGLLVGYACPWALRSVAGTSSTTGPLPVSGPAKPTRSRGISVLRRFRGQLLEYFPWVLVSLALAAVVDAVVPRHLVDILYGQKTAAGTLLASLTGVPFYFCSGAELPLARELLEKGMGRGPATSMLLAVPIVNILTFGVVTRWMGARSAAAYMALCVAATTAIGFAAGLFWR